MRTLACGLTAAATVGEAGLDLFQIFSERRLAFGALLRAAYYFVVAAASCKA